MASFKAGLCVLWYSQSDCDFNEKPGKAHDCPVAWKPGGQQGNGQTQTPTRRTVTTKCRAPWAWL